MSSAPGQSPAIRVADVRRSIAFYAYLGFEVKGELEAEGVPSWAWLATDGAELMLNRGEPPIEAQDGGVLMNLYTRDVGRLHEQLVAAGVDPAWEAGSGKRALRLRDPDGYQLLVSERG
ncbi:MAG: VOC family protein [Candidatus Dormibacteraeota bacterium]|nr:VOC family protein [Candidatus Dormibacteraeota bacterium]